MSALSLKANLDRTDSGTPWGFRLHGGKDFGAPLTIQRVNPGSLAAKCGLQVGDSIVKIGETGTDGLRHKEAQQRIIQSGNSLELTLQRGGSRPAEPAPYSPQPAYSPPAPAAPPSQYPSGPGSANYNAAPKPFTPGGSSTVPVAVNKQYNTPINMYSVGNVMDSLATQTSNVNISGQQPGNDDDAPPPLPTSAPPGSDLTHEHGVTHDNNQNVSKPFYNNTTPSKYTPETQQNNANITTYSSTNEAPGYKSYSSNTEGPGYKAYTTNTVSEGPGFTASNRVTVSSTKNEDEYTAPPRAVIKMPSSSKSAAPQNESHWGNSSSTAQSKSFKKLQNLIDSGEDVVGLEPARGVRKTSVTKKEPEDDGRVQAIMNRQYNTPVNLYSNQNKANTFETQAKGIIDHLERSETDPEKKVYIPSDTYKMVQNDERESSPSDQGYGSSGLDTGSSNQKVIDTPTARMARGVDADKPSAGHNPTHSRTFDILQKSLNQPGGPPSRSAPPAPKPAPVTVGSVGPGGGGGGVWQPSIPTGQRKMKVGRAGEARSMPASGGGGRIPVCQGCGVQIRGPFVNALDRTWCPNHFTCANPHCGRNLIDCGFVEEEGNLYCEKDYEEYLAPRCGKCGGAIVGAIVSALDKKFHTHCFVCAHCRQPIGGTAFHVQDGEPYCERDWASLFQTKCYGCSYPIEPGDRFVNALNEDWHSECFNCSTCQCNLEGQPFFAKAGRPYCKRHAMGGAGGGRF